MTPKINSQWFHPEWIAGFAMPCKRPEHGAFHQNLETMANYTIAVSVLIGAGIGLAL